MTAPRMTRRTPRQLGLPAIVAVLIALVVTLLPGSSSDAAAKMSDAPKPTIVLVHGAFADASGWNAVIGDLQKRGYTAYAPANPLRGLVSDSDYLRSFLATIPGPIVLVGHSYGGAVITNAATGNPNVDALVYIAAYAPDQGETLGEATALGGGSSLLLQHIVLRPFPGSGTTDADGYIDPAFFHDVFAQDLPAKQAAVMAAEQRPSALSALGTPSGVPAWKTIPSWCLVAQDDHVIPPEAERAMAERAHAYTVEVRSSHVAMISHPDTVTALILTAVRGH
jgi:pimeloyl-ACP methyl ester carboxylesterase